MQKIPFGENTDTVYSTALALNIAR